MICGHSHRHVSSVLLGCWDLLNSERDCPVSEALEKPDNFQGRQGVHWSGEAGDPRTKRAPVATSLFRSGHQQLSPKGLGSSVPLQWVVCGSMASCCWTCPVGCHLLKSLL